MKWVAPGRRPTRIKPWDVLGNMERWLGLPTMIVAAALSNAINSDLSGERLMGGCEGVLMVVGNLLLVTDGAGMMSM